MMGRMPGRFSGRVAKWTWATGAAMLALAGAHSPARAAAHVDRGRHLATGCLTRQRAGAATAAIPSIYGLAELTFAEVMKGYRDKGLANPVMQNIAGRLTDDDIAALALFV